MQSQFKLKIIKGKSFYELERDNMLVFIKDSKSNKEEMKKFTKQYDLNKYIIDFVNEKTGQGYMLEKKNEQLITKINESLLSLQEEDQKYEGIFNNIERALESPEKVTELSLTDSVDEESFKYITEMNNLKRIKIKLKGCIIPAEIEKLQNLEELVIYSVSNTIKEIPDSIGRLKKLKKISVENQQLTSLPDSLFLLADLKRLLIGNNKINDLSPDIDKLAVLEELDIRGNPVKFLPDTIGNCTQLRIVTASHCSIHSIPPDIGRLKNLFSLNLGKNYLNELPRELFDCERLQYLYLEQNKLTSVPAGILNLGNLKNLNLAGNYFSPEEIEKLTGIERQFREMKKRVRIEFPRNINEGKAKEIKNTIHLAEKIIEQLDRLGLHYEFEDHLVFNNNRGSTNVEHSTERVYIETASGKLPLPEAYRKFIYDVKWEEKLKKKYKITLDAGMELTGVSLGCVGSGSTSQYECSYDCPFVWIGIFDGGNYLLLLALDDKQQEDPEVYYISHDDFYEKEAVSTGLALSEFLSGLE